MTREIHEWMKEAEEVVSSDYPDDCDWDKKLELRISNNSVLVAGHANGDTLFYVREFGPFCLQAVKGQLLDLSEVARFEVTQYLSNIGELYEKSDRVRLAEFDNGKELISAEDATILAVEWDGTQLMYMIEVAKTGEHDDGLREVSHDQIEERYNSNI
jgi:hypothetical protein